MKLKELSKELKLNIFQIYKYADYTRNQWRHMLDKEVLDLRYKDILAISRGNMMPLDTIIYIIYKVKFDVKVAYNTFWDTTRMGKIVVYYTYLALRESKYRPHRDTLTRIVKQNVCDQLKITWLYYRTHGEDLI